MASETLLVAATPFNWIDPRNIPRRRFVYGHHYARGYLSQTVAAPGVGKSSLAIVEALAIATGRDLLAVQPAEKTSVWYYNGEDPRDELQRRIAAATLFYAIEPSDLVGHLFIDSGRNMPITVALKRERNSAPNDAVVAQIITTIKENRIGVLIVDPFISTHRLSENDNGDMELVATIFARIADETNCAIELVHHPRKTNGAAVDAEDGRGGSSILAKARSVRTLNHLAPNDALAAGVKHAREYFCAANGKGNLVAPGDVPQCWFRLVSKRLPNGDSVGVVEACKKPSAMSSVLPGDLEKAQAAVAAGRYRANAQSPDWAGHAVGKALSIDTHTKAGKTKVNGLLRGWTKEGYFAVVNGQDASRQTRSFLEVGKPAGPVAPATDDASAGDTSEAATPQMLH